MRPPSKILKSINIIISISCFIMLLNGVLALVITPFLPPIFEFSFNLKELGVINGTDGNTYPFVSPPMKGLVWFPDGFQPNYAQNVYIFLLYSLGVIFLFNFQKFTYSFISKRPFATENYKRLLFMGFALWGINLLEMIHFFLFQSELNGLISHDAIEVVSTYSLRYNFNWYYFIGGFIFLTLAEVFKEGYLLKQETELTI